MGDSGDWGPVEDWLPQVLPSLLLVGIPVLVSLVFSASLILWLIGQHFSRDDD